MTEISLLVKSKQNYIALKQNYKTAHQIKGTQKESTKYKEVIAIMLHMWTYSGISTQHLYTMWWIKRGLSHLTLNAKCMTKIKYILLSKMCNL